MSDTSHPSHADKNGITKWVHWLIPCANAEEAKAELAKIVDHTQIVAGYDIHCVGYETPEKIMMVAVTGCGPSSAVHADRIVALGDPSSAGVTNLPSNLMVTRGDGVPLPDQEAALQEFKTQARLGGIYRLLQAIVDSDNKQSRSANADMLAADIASVARSAIP